jgi:UDP-N-acetylmuramoyl-tripeptide--D-alanyl-D-alanine ligase
MMAALDSLARLRSQRSGPLLAVLGDMLELGPTQAQLHRELGREVARLGIDALLGFGPLAAQIVVGAQAGGIEALSLSGADDSVPAAAAWVRERLGTSPGAVLFKASRGLRLERVVAALLAESETQ